MTQFLHRQYCGAGVWCLLAGWMYLEVWGDIGEYHNILPQYPVLYAAPMDNRVCLFDFLLISNSPSETCHSSTVVEKRASVSDKEKMFLEITFMTKLCGLEQDLMLFLACPDLSLCLSKPFSNRKLVFVGRIWNQLDHLRDWEIQNGSNISSLPTDCKSPLCETGHLGFE